MPCTLTNGKAADTPTRATCFMQALRWSTNPIQAACGQHNNDNKFRRGQSGSKCGTRQKKVVGLELMEQMCPKTVWQKKKSSSFNEPPPESATASSGVNNMSQKIFRVNAAPTELVLTVGKRSTEIRMFLWMRSKSNKWLLVGDFSVLQRRLASSPIQKPTALPSRHSEVLLSILASANAHELHALIQTPKWTIAPLSLNLALNSDELHA